MSTIGHFNAAQLKSEWYVSLSKGRKKKGIYLLPSHGLRYDGVDYKSEVGARLSMRSRV